MKKILIAITAVMFSFVSSGVYALDFSSSAAATSNNNTNSQAVAQQQQANEQGQGQQQGIGGNVGNGAGIGNDNSQSTVTYQAREIPVATAYAPALTTSNDTCMGSTSAGAQGLLFGVSFGTTWTDADCITRKDARFIHNAGHRIVALSLMCGKEAVRAAIARAGTPEQMAACSITEMELKEYKEKPVIVEVDRMAPSFDDFD